MSIYESVFIGVISGVLTSAFLFSSISIFRKIVLPWYQTLIYKGTSISGDWYCKGITPKQDAHFTIIQKANILSGTAMLVNRDQNTKYDQVRTFKIIGEIQDRFVIFSLKHTDATRLGASIYLLQVVSDGTELSGARCGYGLESSKIQHLDASLFRDKTISTQEKTTPNQRLSPTASSNRS